MVFPCSKALCNIVAALVGQSGIRLTLLIALHACYNLSAERKCYLTSIISTLPGVANVMRAFIPSMIERKKGIIVNMSSGWGHSTSPGVSAYCASKWGIEGLTKSVAQELPDPLAAIPVNPGVINTDMLQIAFGQSASSYMKPHKWSETAAPFLLNLTRSSNGTSVTVPK